MSRRVFGRGNGGRWDGEELRRHGADADAPLKLCRAVITNSMYDQGGRLHTVHIWEEF